jgi:phenylacetate-CoA ligase
MAALAATHPLRGPGVPHGVLGPDLAGWPERLPPGRHPGFVDNAVIAFYDYAPRAAIAGFQLGRAMAMLSHLRAASPWWREHLARAPAPLRQWSQLPGMDRAAFRSAAAQGPAPLPPAHGSVGEDATSGSSGVPMRFYNSGLWRRLNRHHHHSDLIRHGFDLKASFAALEATPRPGTANGPLRRDQPVFQRNAREGSIEGHARWLATVGPAYLTTAPVLLRGLLDAFEAGAADPPKLDGIVCYAETVDADLRRRARAILGARIVDRYCCQEVGPLAFQCPKHEDRLHVCVTNAIIEVLDEAGRPSPPGEVGRLFVTGLHNWASPAVRYEIGDMAAARQGCPCGFQGTVLEQMLGRKRFLVRLPSGERKYVYIAAADWVAIAPFSERRIVQPDEGVIRAEVVLDRPITAGEEAAVVAMLKDGISPDLRYEVVQVEAIDWGPTYKRQDVVSLV